LGGALLLGLRATPELTPVAVGSRAPDFRAVNLASGDTVSLSEYGGDVVLFNIWATWCAPCEYEMPSMQRLYDRLGPRGLRIVALSVDQARPQHVVDWVQERELTFDILHDPTGRIEQTYLVTGYPESYVIDRDGMIVKKVIGPREWDHATEQALFRQLLGIADEAPDSAAVTSPEERRARDDVATPGGP
jgi:peroxiredoxin